MRETFDKIIIGAGLYGLYSALRCGQKGEKILVLEADNEPFKRATYINQARVHGGYHYPRSYSTAIKSARYFERFCEDFEFCNFTSFEQIYATSSNFSWTTANEFKKFCDAANIMCEPIPFEKYFKSGMCDGAFITKEYTYDAQILKNWIIKKLAALPNVKIKFSMRVEEIRRDAEKWDLFAGGQVFSSPFVLNATYAGINEIHSTAGFEPFKIKYELCEIILCKVSDNLKNVGITVMDGPFFSIMPFGKTGLHSLTSVTFTPHKTSYNVQAKFPCQGNSAGFCKCGRLANCNDCPAKPQSAWSYMSALAKKYLRDEFKFEYVKSLFSMKPILTASEIDDSRPTVIREMCSFPKFVSVLSGKINTVYDLDEVLCV